MQRAGADDWVGAQVSLFSWTRRAQVGMRRYSSRGLRERWNGRYPVREEMPGRVTLPRSEQEQVPDPDWESTEMEERARRPCAAPVGIWTTLKDIAGVGAREERS